MRFGVGVRFQAPNLVALVGNVAMRSRAGVTAGGKVTLSGTATARYNWKAGLGSVPVITSTSFSISTSPAFNTLVGTIVATNSPTSFAITSGNSAGFFSVNTAGNLRIGISAVPPDNNYSLTFTATNSFGTSPAKSIAVTVGAVPAVAAQTLNIVIPATAGADVGIVTATAGTPTSFAITAGNSSGYFAIDNSGDITVTAAGASGLTAQTYALTVSATNALGTGTGTVSVAASSSAPSQADFRSVASTVYGARTNTTVNKPTGTVDGDIMIAELFVGATGAAPTVTPPAGWTAIGTATLVNDGSFFGGFNVYWKRASSEGTSYTFTHTGGSSECLIASYSGCVTSGSPIGATSVNSGTTGATSTATSITTTSANSRVLFVQHGWDVGSVSPPAGMTERFESLIYLADYLATSAGATGARTGTIPQAPWSACLIELRSQSTTPIAPIVSAQSFNVQLPVSSGGAVGIVLTTGGTPDSFAITAGNSLGYFAIDSNGSITVTTAGGSGVTAQTFSLTVQATNTAGSGSGTVSVVVSSASNVRHATTANFAATVAAASNGDTILLAAGNYGTWAGTNKSITISPEAGVSPTISLACGNAAANFTIDGLHTEISSSDAGMVRAPQASFTSPGIVINTITFTGTPGPKNITIRRCWFAPQTNSINDIVQIDGPTNTNILFDRCYWHDSTGAGNCVHFPYSGDAFVTFKNCYWYNCSNDGCQTGASQVTFDDCEFDTVNPLGVSELHTDCIQIYYGSNITIRRCYFHNFEQAIGGFNDANNTNPMTSNNVITDNVLIGAPYSGVAHWITLMADDPGSLVDHNTNDGALFFYSKPSSHASKTFVRNNICAGVNTSQGAGYTDAALGQNAANSFTKAAVTFVGGSNPTTWAGFKLATGSAGKGAATDGADVGARIP